MQENKAGIVRSGVSGFTDWLCLDESLRNETRRGWGVGKWVSEKSNKTLLVLIVVIFFG